MTGTALTEEQRLSLLLRQIKWAEEKTAFYRAAFERAGVSAASVSSFAEAARLPLLECAEEEGADAPFFMLTLPLSGLLRMSVLRDDAGRGRIHCYTQRDVARQVQTVTDMLAACGVNRASTVLLAGDFADSRMLDLQYALDGIGAAVLPCGGGAAAAQVLCAAVPDTIIVWEHELLALEKYLGDIAVHRLITVGTHIAPQQASRALAERMGARHTHIFTLAQMGTLIGAACTAGAGITLEERLFYAEVIDKAGHSSREDGAHGELVLSTIAAEAMPVLRYRTGLHVRLVRESTQISIIEE